MRCIEPINWCHKGINDHKESKEINFFMGQVGPKITLSASVSRQASSVKSIGWVNSDLASRILLLRLSASPGALAGVLQKDLRMSAGDHRLLNIHPVDEQLTDGSAIAIDGDPAKADRPSDHHRSKVITGSSGPFRLSPLPFQLGSVDASQPDPFTVSGSAGVAVVAAADGDGLQGCSRKPKQQQQGS